MTYGFQAFDQEGRITADSRFPVYVLERVVTLLGQPVTYFDTNRQGHASFDINNPTDPVRSIQYFPANTVAHYRYNIKGAVLDGDPTASKAILAFEIKVGNMVIYYRGVNANFSLALSSSLRVAVLKPASDLSYPSGKYGALALNEAGDVTFNTEWPTCVIQGPLGLPYSVETDWFALFGVVRRRRYSPDGGPSISGYSGATIGMRRTAAMSVDLRYGLIASPGSPMDGFNANSQDAVGLVLQNIDLSTLS